jgi:hypothetical protein
VKRLIIRAFSVAASCLILSACSWSKAADAVGSLGTTSVYGNVEYSSSFLADGRLHIQSNTGLTCIAYMQIENESFGIARLRLTDRIYVGRIACNDGRTGRFKFVSPAPNSDGMSGTITGEIDGKPISLRVVDGPACDGKNCSGQFRKPFSDSETQKNAIKLWD